MATVTDVVSLGGLSAAVQNLPEPERQRLSAHLAEFEKALSPLWTSATEADLDLHEEDAILALWHFNVSLTRRLVELAIDASSLFAEAARQATEQLPALRARLASEAGIHIARRFERVSQVLADVMATVGRSLGTDATAPELPADLPPEALADPVFRDLMLAQTYAVAVASAAEKSDQPLPALIAAMTARAYRGLTSYQRLAALLDPRDSGLLRPRYHPLRNPGYRRDEEALLASHLASPAGKQTLRAIDAAVDREPEVVD